MFVQHEQPTLVENNKSDSEPLDTETAEVKIANNYEDRLKSASELGGKARQNTPAFSNTKIFTYWGQTNHFVRNWSWHSSVSTNTQKTPEPTPNGIHLILNIPFP